MESLESQKCIILEVIFLTAFNPINPIPHGLWNDVNAWGGAIMARIIGAGSKSNRNATKVSKLTFK